MIKQESPLYYIRRNKQKFIFITLAVLVLICFGLFYPYSKQQNQSDNQSNSSLITETTKIIQGNSMEPLIQDGQEAILLENYYQRNEVQRGDIVAYDYKGNKNPLIKKVEVVGGDTLEFKVDKLLVNNEILSNGQKEPYIFSEKQKKMIGLYIKKEKLVDNSYLLFGENIYNSLDSRRFGAVSVEGFLGKFDY